MSFMLNFWRILPDSVGCLRMHDTNIGDDTAISKYLCEHTIIYKHLW